MRRVSISYSVVVAIAVFCSPTASAQTTGPPPSPQTAVAGDDDAGRTDLIDLIRMWRKKPPAPASERQAKWTIVPILSSKPGLGVKLGAGADVEFKLGDPATTRFSSLTSSLAFSTHKQVSVSENVRLYGPHNRWKVEGQNHYNGKSSDNVMLGTSSISEVEPDIRYYSLQFVDTYYYRFHTDLYIGAGLDFRRQMQIEPAEDSPDFETTPFRQYSDAHGFDRDTQTSAGLRAALLFDNRDNQNDAVRGWYVLAAYRTHFNDFLGGDSAWRDVTAEVRTYRPLTADKRHKLAFWGLADFITSGTAPYLSLPATGADELGRSARGYEEGRYRGEQLVYGEVEYRGLLTRNGFLGTTAFLNVTTIGNRTTGERVFDSAAFAAGAGLRFLVHKHSRSNFCVDFAFGRDGSHGLYISFRDAF